MTPMQTAPAPEWFTPRTLAAFWQVHEESIRRWVRDGSLQANRVGPRMLRISRTDAAVFLATRCAIVNARRQKNAI
jgi:excisionase family DNA binding protein